MLMPEQEMEVDLVEPRYCAMVKRCLAGRRSFGMTAVDGTWLISLRIFLLCVEKKKKKKKKKEEPPENRIIFTYNRMTFTYI